MAVRILFLGCLQDLAPATELSLPGPLTWEALLAAVPDALGRELGTDRVRLAREGRVLADKAGLLARDGEEVALLPPVSGG